MRSGLIAFTRAASRGLALLLPVALSPIVGATSPPSLPTWLSGCWQGEGAAAGVTEAWSSGRSGQMLGLSETLRGSRAGFEFLRITTARDASLQLMAQPGGRPPVVFTADVVEPDRISFANPAHDAPKRIEYRREGEKLVALLDPAPGAAPTFTFRRTSCDALFAPR